MPQIIVTTDHGSERGDAPILLREWVNRSDFDSELFGRHLVERLGWAIEDACRIEDAARVEDAAQVDCARHADEADRARPAAGELAGAAN